MQTAFYCLNLVWAVLVPFLKARRQSKVVDLLYSINNLRLEIQWYEIIEFQLLCLT
jgi:hypothetical protein